MSTVQSQVLASISANAMLNFTLGGNELLQIGVIPVASQSVLGLVPAGPSTTFTAVDYAFNGTNQAKISLQLNNRFWFSGSNPIMGIAYPMILTTQPADFLLTDTGGGDITIQTTFSPPAPYVQTIHISGQTYLGYGFDSALLNLFNISVVG